MSEEVKQPRYKVPKTWSKKKPEDLVYAPSRKPLEPELKDKLDLACEWLLTKPKAEMYIVRKDGKVVKTSFNKKANNGTS